MNKQANIAEYRVKVSTVRSNLELSQAEFAMALGVSSLTVSRWERGIAEPVQIYREMLDALDTSFKKSKTAAKKLARELIEITPHRSVLHRAATLSLANE